MLWEARFLLSGETEKSVHGEELSVRKVSGHER